MSTHNICFLREIRKYYVDTPFTCSYVQCLNFTELGSIVQSVACLTADPGVP